MSAFDFPPPLREALGKEGSDLHIQRASEHNLDWDWRVTFTRDYGGLSLTAKGADLERSLWGIVDALEQLGDHPSDRRESLVF